MTATEEFPYELRRGGIIWGVDREITDDDTAAMFVIDGEVAPRLWAAQAFPVIGDTLQAAAVGIAGDLLHVEARLWQSANLVLIGCVHFEPATDTGGDNTMTATEKYPLWCVDTGTGEARYSGPYDTEAEANTAHRAYFGSDPDVQVHRCRRVAASEGSGLARVGDVVEYAEELAGEGELPDAAWRDFDETIVTAKPGAQAALLAWADEHLSVEAFVCEGDEPAEVTQ